MLVRVRSTCKKTNPKKLFSFYFSVFWVRSPLIGPLLFYFDTLGTPPKYRGYLLRHSFIGFESFNLRQKKYGVLFGKILMYTLRTWGTR
jgi:hypothetical protein